jgi:hypothetical protein
MRTPESILQFRDLKKVGLLINIVIEIPLLWFLLKWMELPRLLRLLDHPSNQRGPLKEDDFERVHLIWNFAHFVLVKSLKIKNPCLYRSLILFHFLRRRGLHSQIHFGIKKDVSPIEGHSWLSLNGEVFLEKADLQLNYADIYSYPS